jgi:hypothetical protein
MEKEVPCEAASLFWGPSVIQAKERVLLRTTAVPI